MATSTQRALSQKLPSPQWQPINGRHEDFMVLWSADSQGKKRPFVKSVSDKQITPVRSVKKRKIQATVSSLNHSMLTRRKTAKLSLDAVFGTSELFENILIDIPPAQLIKIRRVSRYWNTLILGTPCLQRQLFLRAVPETKIWAWDSTTQSVRLHKSGDREKLGEEWYLRNRKMLPAIVNPLLFEEDVKRKPRGLNGEAGDLLTKMLWCDWLRFIDKPSMSSSTQQRSLVHRMLVAQPPPTIVEFKITFFASKPKRALKPSGVKATYNASDTVRTEVHNNSGVTFGDLVSEFRRVVHRQTFERDIDALSVRKGFSTVWMKGVCFPTDTEERQVREGMWDAMRDA